LSGGLEGYDGFFALRCDDQQIPPSTLHFLPIFSFWGRKRVHFSVHSLRQFLCCHPNMTCPTGGSKLLRPSWPARRSLTFLGIEGYKTLRKTLSAAVFSGRLRRPRVLRSFVPSGLPIHMLLSLFFPEPSYFSRTTTRSLSFRQRVALLYMVRHLCELLPGLT